MRRSKQLIMGLAILSLATHLFSCATVQPDDRIRAKVLSASFAKPGDTVKLFYGMSKTAKEEFCPDAIVSVYRLGEGYYVSKDAVGKIKVTHDLGDHYLEAIVVEGELRTDDIAMQSNSECLLKVQGPSTE